MTDIEHTLKRGLEEAADRLATPETPIEDIVARGKRRKTSAALMATLGTAAAVVLVIGGTSVLLSIGTVSPPADDAPPIVAGSVTTEATTTTLEPTVPPTTTPGPAPWGGETAAQADVPSVLVDEWNGAENRQWCAALAPVEVVANSVATPRAAAFSGGWAVAWDAPSGPGTDTSGTPCTDCGRSAFGIAGTGTTPDADTAVRQPNVVYWEDGSVAGYGGEGFDAAATKRLAEIVVAEQGCVYQVWSHLGDEHLVSLIESLRFVDGLDAGPVELLASLPAREIDGGAAPWAAQPLPAGAIPSVLADQWTSESARLYFGELGPELAGASVRSASLGTWGVAWDLASGPGHDRNNVACSACGRGVIGLGLVAPWSDGLAPPDDPVAIRWDDGSTAVYGVRIGQPRVPMELQRITDPDTGRLIHPGYEATVIVEGVGEFVVWSHLGEDHLQFLLGQLRFVS